LLTAVGAAGLAESMGLEMKVLPPLGVTDAELPRLLSKLRMRYGLWKRSSGGSYCCGGI
jgi:hypothetical protein